MSPELSYIQQAQINRVKQKLHKTGYPCVSSDTYVKDSKAFAAAREWARQELFQCGLPQNLQILRSPKKSGAQTRSSSQVATPIGSNHYLSQNEKFSKYVTESNVRTNKKPNLRIQQPLPHGVAVQQIVSPSRCLKYNQKEEYCLTQPKNYRLHNTNLSSENENVKKFHQVISKSKKTSSAARPSPVISSKIDYEYGNSNEINRQAHRHHIYDDSIINNKMFAPSKYDKSSYSTTLHKFPGASKNNRGCSNIGNSNHYLYYSDLPRNSNDSISSKYRLNSPLSSSRIQLDFDSGSNKLSDSFENDTTNYLVKRNFSRSTSSKKNSDLSSTSLVADSEHEPKKFTFTSSTMHKQPNYSFKEKNEVFIAKNIACKPFEESLHYDLEMLKQQRNNQRTYHRRSHSVVPSRSKPPSHQAPDNDSNTDEQQDCPSPPSVLAINSSNLKNFEPKTHSKRRQQSHDVSLPDSGYQSRRTIPSKHSSKVFTLPNLHKGEALTSNSSKTEDQTQLDLAVRKALQKIALENMTLKQYIAKTKEKNQRIMNRLCEELETRSRQQRNITQTIQKLQNYKDRVEADINLPQWISITINSIIEQLYDVVIVPQKPESLPSMDGCGSFNGRTSRSVHVPVREQSQNKTVSPDNSFAPQNSGNNLPLMSSSRQTNSLNSKAVDLENHSKNNFDTNIPEKKQDFLQKIKRSSHDEANYSDSSHVEILSDSSSSLETNESAIKENINDSQKYFAGQNNKTPAATCVQTRPHIPTLSLKEKNVGVGSWLSGDQTQGDTYNDVS